MEIKKIQNEFSSKYEDALLEVKNAMHVSKERAAEQEKKSRIQMEKEMDDLRERAAMSVQSKLDVMAARLEELHLEDMSKLKK